MQSTLLEFKTGPALPVRRRPHPRYAIECIDRTRRDGTCESYITVTHEVSVQLMGHDGQPVDADAAEQLLIEGKWNAHQEWFYPGTTYRNDRNMYYIKVPDDFRRVGSTRMYSSLPFASSDTLSQYGRINVYLQALIAAYNCALLSL